MIYTPQGYRPRGYRLMNTLPYRSSSTRALARNARRQVGYFRGDWDRDRQKAQRHLNNSFNQFSLLVKMHTGRNLLRCGTGFGFQGGGQIGTTSQRGEQLNAPVIIVVGKNDLRIFCKI